MGADRAEEFGRRNGVAGERADLDGEAGADERGQHREELALLRSDLHAGGF